MSDGEAPCCSAPLSPVRRLEAGAGPGQDRAAVLGVSARLGPRSCALKERGSSHVGEGGVPGVMPLHADGQGTSGAWGGPLPTTKLTETPVCLTEKQCGPMESGILSHPHTVCQPHPSEPHFVPGKQHHLPYREVVQMIYDVPVMPCSELKLHKQMLWCGDDNCSHLLSTYLCHWKRP